MLTLGNSSCGTAPDLNWHPKPYVTNTEAQAIVRKKEDGTNDVISCSDPDFNGRVCFTGEELVDFQNKYNDVINRCEKWAKPSTKTTDDVSSVRLFCENFLESTSL